MDAQRRSVADVAAEVGLLVADPKVLTRFRAQVSEYLRKHRDYCAAHLVWSEGLLRRVLAAQGNRRLTDKNAGPPGANRVWHNVQTGDHNPDGTVKLNPDGSRPVVSLGAWIDPDPGPEPTDPRSARWLAHDYAKLAAAHDQRRVVPSKNATAHPIISEDTVAHGVPPKVGAAKILCWRQLERDISDPGHAELMVNELNEALARVRHDLAPAPEPKALPTKSDAIDDNTWLAEADLAREFRRNPNTLRKRLRKWRPHHLDNSWQQAPHPKPRDPRFLYRVGAVRAVIESLPTRTGERPAKTKKR